MTKLLPILLLLTNPALAAETKVTLKVVSVHDGDTFTGPFTDPTSESKANDLENRIEAHRTDNLGARSVVD
jgi:hypothetical protein